MRKHIFELDILGKSLHVEIGELALHANGSCLVRYGDTVVLATAVMSDEVREGVDFFPLMVEYEEKLYAVGKIKGSRFIKREGRPSDEAVLISRKIDRGIRPLFPKNLKNDVQVIVSVLSYDSENSPDVPSIIASSIALHISNIPWDGPVAAMRVGYIDNKFILNPTESEQENSLIDLVITTTKDKVLMVDSSAKEMNEEIHLKAFEFGLKFAPKIIDFINNIQSKIGKEKICIEKEVFTFDNKVISKEDIIDELKEFLKDKWDKYLFDIPKGTKKERKKILETVKQEAEKFLIANYNNEIAENILKDFYNLAEQRVSEAILYENKRVDGRGLNDLRQIKASVGLFPRTHGSALFSRGETQVVSIVTLGSPGDEQILDGMEEIGRKRYMHHYNFPPFSVGEVKPLKGASRRDIGHGALAEKALLPVLPPKEEFPYTIRVVSEVLGSNGSSSMASTCGSSLALMDAGVPIKRPVAGIAIGLASDNSGKFKILTDIQDLEDGEGGMDFKICGTKKGITAIQMDTKTKGLSLEIIEKTLKQGHSARLKILDIMEKAISKPRSHLSKYAPRIIKLQIKPEKIREVIGPGGKMINSIIEETNVVIDIEQDGTIFITAQDKENAEKAKKIIEDIAKEIEVGQIYSGKVTRITDFGAFIQISPYQEGLVHISELSDRHVRKVSDILKIGQEVKAKVLNIDEFGRINLSIKKANSLYASKKDNKNFPKHKKPIYNKYN